MVECLIGHVVLYLNVADWCSYCIQLWLLAGSGAKDPAVILFCNLVSKRIGADLTVKRFAERDREMQAEERERSIEVGEDVILRYYIGRRER